jgi:putative DNA primase/helicase
MSGLEQADPPADENRPVDGIPNYLVALPRWLLWRTEPRVNKATGEITATKVPISYHTSKRCDAHDPRNWTTHANVAHALATRTGAWDGAGFALGEVEHLAEVIIGLDSDSCLRSKDDDPADWALPFFRAMPSFADISPSDTGIKIIARIKLADLPAARRLLGIGEAHKEQARTRTFGERTNGAHAPGAQLFLGKRFFTITGRPWPTAPEDVRLLTLEDIARLGEAFGPTEQASNDHGPANDNDDEPDETTLRAKLEAAKAKNPRLKSRWEGGTEGLKDTSRSGRDMSVLAMLVKAGFTKGETRAALRLFEHGKLPGEEPRYFEEMWRRTKATPSTPDASITEQSVMRTFVVLYADRLRFNHGNKQWLVWQEHYWRPDRKQLAFSWALDLCRSQPPNQNTQKVRFSAAVETGARAMREVATAQEDWDTDPWLLGTPGGVIDLRSGELRPGRPEDMITLTTGCVPADGADCPRWLEFLHYALNNNEQNICFLQRYSGYSLTGIIEEEFFIFLHGGGGTGKGTVTETVRHVMGDYARALPIEMFTDQRWRALEYYRAQLAGRRLITASEPARGSIWSENFINEMTGGDTLSGRHPSGRPFDFRPTHKPWISGNYIPNLHGIGTGLKRRLGLLPFDRKPAKPDPKLKAKLRAEGPGILRWMIDGCITWQQVGLCPPPDVVAASAAYFNTQDTFGRWVDECCILDPSLQLEPNQLRTAFNAWARANGEAEMNGNEFAEAIQHFQGAQLRSIRVHGRRFVRGIGLQATKHWGDTG